ncbi:MAG: hypothetical protein IPG06_20925 [Haliea sp.]|nr:hypothetical protein [Haliea sp.]
MLTAAAYLNQAAVIASFEKGRFRLVAEAAINANPLDHPAGDDSVGACRRTARQ